MNITAKQDEGINHTMFPYTFDMTLDKHYSHHTC